MAPRRLQFEIYRYDPNVPQTPPRMDHFEIEEEPMMNLFTVLNRIREENDPSLMFDFSCRASVCGSCAMVINGRPRLACQTLTATLPLETTLHPLPVFKHVGDLCVDTGTWFRSMYQNVGSWVHTDTEFDPKALEQRLPNDMMLEIYELERCIECGSCVAACGTANVREDFVGAVGINKIARFRADPRDTRSEAEYYEVVGDDDGVFGCMTLLGCQDVCPKDLSLQTQIAFLRRKMVRQGLKLG